MRNPTAVAARGSSGNSFRLGSFLLLGVFLILAMLMQTASAQTETRHRASRQTEAKRLAPRPISTRPTGSKRMRPPRGTAARLQVPTPGSGGTTGASSDETAAPPSASDPAVGIVEGHPITLSEVGRASKALPEPLRSLPFDTLYPVLLDRMVDHQALVIMARRIGLEADKQVQRDIQTATDRILEAAYLADVAAPLVTEQAIAEVYSRDYINRPATEEVRARHILVPTEAEARAVLDDLKKGADFATIARVASKDPDASKGGDLGFFRREQVWPSFADVAFALQPGQVAPDPVRNEFGWHVIKVEERRLVAPPGFADVHDRIRQDLLEAAVRQAIADARKQVVIRRFNMDGSVLDSPARSGVLAQ